MARVVAADKFATRLFAWRRHRSCHGSLLCPTQFVARRAMVYMKCIVRSAHPFFPRTTYAAFGLCELPKWVKCSDENVSVCYRIVLV